MILSYVTFLHIISPRKILSFYFLVNMNVEEYINQKKELQQNFLTYLDSTEDSEDEYEELLLMINNQNIHGNRYELELFLRFIMKVTKYYHRSKEFFSKLEKILLTFKDDLSHYFTNAELFNICKSNKRIILFLLEEKLITPGNIQIPNLNYKYRNYYQYFSPEFDKNQNNDNDQFFKNRKIGENDDYVSQLIREDQVQEFIAYATKYTLKLDKTIEHSIFETNNYLINKSPTLIEYATFFGSIQILRYLSMNNVNLTPSLWNYAVHSNSPEVIHFLEENEVEPINKDYINLIKESIKCNHNSIANYFIDKFFDFQDKSNDEDYSVLSIKYYNFSFFPEDLTKVVYFNSLCRYQYAYLVDIITSDPNFDVDFDICFNILIHKKNLEIPTILLKNRKIKVEKYKECSLLKSLTIPSTVTTIEDEALFKCKNLIEITIPTSVTYIGKSAFENCNSLKSITIPSSVTSINEK